MNPPDFSQCGDQIALLLTQQTEHVDNYIAYLKGIKQAIAQNETGHLNDLLKKQPHDPKKIEQLQIKQASILSQYGFNDSDQALTDCINACENSTQLHSLKEVLVEKLKQLEQSLQVNAFLVQKSQHRIKQSICLLSGHELNNTATRYSRYGNMENDEENSHSLAQA